MKAGAIEFLTKPVEEQDLLNAFQEASQNARRASSSRQSPAELFV
jgi:FixJ family two-component response regulator